MAFPLFVLAMAMVAALGNRVENIVVATAVINLPFYIRFARAEVNVRRNLGWVEAARASGNSHTRVVLRFLLPNVLPAMAVQISLNLGWAILNAAGLSFIGLGVRPPTPEWGIMVAEAAWLHEPPVVEVSAPCAAKIDQPVLAGVLHLDHGMASRDALGQQADCIFGRPAQAARAVNRHDAPAGHFEPRWMWKVCWHGGVIAWAIRDEKRAVPEVGSTLTSSHVDEPTSPISMLPSAGSWAILNGLRKPYAQIARYGPVRVSANGLSSGMDPSGL